MQAVSDNLIHFLDRQHKESPNEQFGTFQKIIKGGLKLNKTKITFGDDKWVKNYLVCFTDIPLSLCDEHTDVYGKFGIGFNKSSIKRCGGNPARYFIDYLHEENKNGSELDNSGAMYENLRSHLEIVSQLSEAVDHDKFALFDQNGKKLLTHEGLVDWVAKQKTILSFEKETGNKTKIIDSYYKEREWRLVPLEGNLRSGSVIRDQTEDSYYYRFKRNDVNMVVTPNDEIRIAVVRFLLGLDGETDERLKEFGQNPLPVITYDDLNKW